MTAAVIHPTMAVAIRLILAADIQDLGYTRRCLLDRQLPLLLLLHMTRFDG